MTRNEARKILLEELNKGIAEKNAKASQEFLEANRRFVAGRGRKPTMPYLLKRYSMKTLNQAVAAARRSGEYAELLEQAGF
jgi:predicted metal-dependent hydrolase